MDGPQCQVIFEIFALSFDVQLTKRGFVVDKLQKQIFVEGLRSRPLNYGAYALLVALL